MLFLESHSNTAFADEKNIYYCIFKDAHSITSYPVRFVSGDGINRKATNFESEFQSLQTEASVF